jgi:hypothetical protein
MTYRAIGAVAALSIAAAFGSAKAAAAIEPGVFTQCVAWNNNVTYAVLGAGNSAQCFQLARECTGNPNVRATWYGSAVLVQTPFTLCRRR